jgi:hypothetical protein
MESCFNTIHERKGRPFKTKPLFVFAAAVHEQVRTLARYAAVIKTHFIARPGWIFRIFEGSLTFQHYRNPHKVIKLFIDRSNELAQKAGIALHPDPLVIGIELTHENPFVRQRIRDFLSEEFPETYLDPRMPRRDSIAVVNNDKYWLVPHKQHCYDIVFIPREKQLYQVEKKAIASFEQRIMRSIDTR